MALQPNYSTYLSQKNKLVTLAKRLGYVQKRNGESVGNLRALLEAISNDELLVLPNVVSVSLPETQDVEMQQRLLSAGLITEIKPLKTRKFSKPSLIEVTGISLSQQIIEDRR